MHTPEASVFHLQSERALQFQKRPAAAHLNEAQRNVSVQMRCEAFGRNNLSQRQSKSSP